MCRILNNCHPRKSASLYGRYSSYFIDKSRTFELHVRVRSIDRVPKKRIHKRSVANLWYLISGPLEHYIHRDVLFQESFYRHLQAINTEDQPVLLSDTGWTGVTPTNVLWCTIRLWCRNSKLICYEGKKNNCIDSYRQYSGLPRLTVSFFVPTPHSNDLY